ncbi:MAG: LamG-like jellyroll fold domain-containing protein [Planctomycetia bacterium]|nr:LamG-like jellyroll fold domain-containing protein [Planctomycetia bacterium]
MTNNTDLLICQYIDGTLTESDALVLGNQLERDPALRKVLRDNLLVHFLLNEQYLRYRSVQAGREMYPLPACLSGEGTVVDAGQQGIPWDELVRLQNAERPVSAIVAEYRAALAARGTHLYMVKGILRFARKCIWPTRRDFEESIAPVVTLLVAFLLAATITIFMIERSLRPDLREPITAMARVNETIDPVWEENEAGYKRGQIVDSSSFRLKSGLVQLEMNNGTTLILEGPAELTISTAMNAFCYSGKVSVHVPKKGHGYTINTPSGSIVDRGTDFFLEVDKDQSLVETIKGKVDVISAANEAIRLVAGKGMKLFTSSQMEMFDPLHDSEFYSSPRFEKKVKEQAEKMLETKDLSRQKENADPHLIVCFDFGKNVSDSFLNEAPFGRSLCPQAELRQGRTVEGILSATRAVAFKTENSGVTCHLPGEYRSMTFVMDVRIDYHVNMSNTLLVSDSFYHGRGGIRWQISRSGALQFFVKENDEIRSFVTHDVLRNMRPGTWITLAVVLDADKKKITHYLDGRPIISVPWANPGSIVPGALIIGNGPSNSPSNNSSFFDGAIERALIYDYAAVLRVKPIYTKEPQ